MKNTIRNLLTQNSVLSKPLRDVYRTFIHHPIWKHFTKNQPFFFVQIGSNDGQQGDPIYNIVRHNDKWSGLLVEPVPFLFKRLQHNYQEPDRFTLENVAIAPENGTLKFYYVSESAWLDLGEELPQWFDQVGSLSKEHILKHLPTGLSASRLEPYIVEADVESLRLSNLLSRNNIAKIDLLHIDTEGFDYQILSQVDFKQYQPRVILYEHIHLSPSDQLAAEALLKEQGYICCTHGNIDTLAVQRQYYS